jgi:ubiquinone/menaquinone biosynthesis C-methylase UbiE
MSDDAPWNRYGGTAGDVYEREMVPRLFAPWAELHLRAADLRAGDRVLDVACGTGVVARRAAAAVGPAGRAVGLDFNEVMLTTARASDSDGAVEWRQGDAQELPFDDGSFDAVSCQHGVMFFPDRAKALREMRRVLRPGGRVVVSVWSGLDGAPGYAALSDALVRHVGPEAGHLPPFTMGTRRCSRTY